MIRIIQICILLWLSSTTLHAEQQQFVVKIAGAKIGNVTAVKTQKDSATTYKLVSFVHVWLFTQITVFHEVVSVYVNGKLVKSTVNSIINGKTYHSSIVSAGAQYKYTVNAYKYSKSGMLNGPIKTSVSKLYFEQPDKDDQVLAENYAELSAVREVRPKTFQITVQGNNNNFCYLNGVLQKVEMKSPIKNYEIVRVDD